MQYQIRLTSNICATDIDIGTKLLKEDRISRLINFESYLLVIQLCQHVHTPVFTHVCVNNTGVKGCRVLNTGRKLGFTKVEIHIFCSLKAMEIKCVGSDGASK